MCEDYECGAERTEPIDEFCIHSIYGIQFSRLNKQIKQDNQDDVQIVIKHNIARVINIG